MRAVLARRASLPALRVCFAACALACSVGRAETVTLANGMQLEGSLGKIARLGADPLKAAGTVDRLPIIVVDNQLTRTFTFQDLGRLKYGGTPPPPQERFEIDQRVQLVGRRITSVGPILKVEPFDEWGHRTFSMSSTSGTVEVVQGITIITPKWTQVEAIQGPGSFVWMMRIATSSIPKQQLSKILHRLIDPKNSDQRLRIVRLYLQSERFRDARAELEQLIKDFPDLARLQDQVKTLRQLEAQRLLKEIELRQGAGQYRLAIEMLEGFPADGVAGEMLLKVRETLQAMGEQKAQGGAVVKQLGDLVAALKEEKTRAEVQPIIDEIQRDLNANTLERMADYLRLADEAGGSPEQKLSLAISGWLMGSGAGLENFGTSVSLVQVRDLVRKYLVSTRQPDRDVILSEMTSLAGATPEYVAKIIAHMKPPLPTAELEEPANLGNPAEILGIGQPPAAGPARAPQPVVPPRHSAQPAAGNANGQKPAAAPNPQGGCDDPPAAAADGGVPKALPAVADPAAALPAPTMPNAPQDASGIPGMLELTTKGIPEDPQLKYCVQLPPQYDPYRRYPCVVTLNGAGTTPHQQIDWWAGGYDPQAKTRFGQATRHGYIVIAPRWTREHQRKYEYSSREHAAVLLTLRDACKRLAIDTDRVFLSGHSMGGDAAWDIGLSHPDLWAGVIPIVAAAEKYVAHYSENAKHVPLYFVCGEKDGDKLAQNADAWNRYVSYLDYDAMIVQYQGRGHEHFLDEILNIFTWMNLHKRNFFVRDFSGASGVDSLRPWDNFFWWVECSKFLDANMVLPAEWGDKDKKPRPARTEGRALATNGVYVNSAARKVTAWLAPEIVNFDAPMSITINGKRRPAPQPSVATILEDVRTRGDRLHPFWAKVEN